MQKSAMHYKKDSLELQTTHAFKIHQTKYSEKKF